MLDVVRTMVASIASGVGVLSSKTETGSTFSLKEMMQRGTANKLIPFKERTYETNYNMIDYGG